MGGMGLRQGLNLRYFERRKWNLRRWDLEGVEEFYLENFIYGIALRERERENIACN
jgi:hypothetical protein